MAEIRNVVPEHIHLQQPDKTRFRMRTNSYHGEDLMENMILLGICSILKPFPSWVKGTHNACLGRLAHRAVGTMNNHKLYFYL